MAELDALVNRGLDLYHQYLAENGRDFLNSNAITSVVATLFWADQKYTPAEHLKNLFPKYVEFAEER